MKKVIRRKDMDGREYLEVAGDEGATLVIIGGETDNELLDHYRSREDERLNRWRDPENPNMVCYKAKRGGVFIVDERSVDESSGDGSLWFQNQVSSFGYKNKRFHEKHDTAYRYFQLHPAVEDLSLGPYL